MAAAEQGLRHKLARPRLIERWLRRRTRLTLPLTLAYRQIFILPTRFGWMVGVLMTAMLIGSLNFNNNLGLLTTFVLAGIAVNSMLLAYRNLRGLQLRHGHARPVHAKTPVPWQLTVTQDEPYSRTGLILTDGQERTIFELPERGSRVVTLTLPGRARGWHEPGRLRIETTQPLGLFRAWSWFEAAEPFLVWPRPVAHAPPLPEGTSDQHGQRKANREEGEDFHSLRRWREGDPLHRIAWKASQRHDTLLSREFRRERSREVELSLETAPGRDLEERISILTAWILQCESDQRPWLLAMPTGPIGPGQGERQMPTALRALAEL